MSSQCNLGCQPVDKCGANGKNGNGTNGKNGNGAEASAGASNTGLVATTCLAQKQQSKNCINCGQPVKKTCGCSK